MLIPEPNRPGPLARRTCPAKPAPRWSVLACCAAVLMLIATGCKKDPAMQAIETDANGYLCLNCGAKFYTERSVFIGPQCPKCKQDTLMDVVGYECPQGPSPDDSAPARPPAAGVRRMPGPRGQCHALAAGKGLEGVGSDEVLAVTPSANRDLTKLVNINNLKPAPL